MLHKRSFLPLFSLTLFTSALLAKGVAGETKSLANVLPAGALAFVELSDLGAVVDRIEQSGYLEWVEKSPQFEKVRKQPDMQKLEAGIKLAEVQLGMKLPAAFKAVFGSQVAGAIYADKNPKEPPIVIVAKSSDAKAFTQIADRLRALLIFAGDKVQTKETIGGKPAVIVDNKLFVVVESDWVAVATKRELLETTLSNLAGKGVSNVAASSAYRAATTQFAGTHHVFAFGDLAEARKLFGKNGRIGSEKPENVMAALLFGGIIELAQHAPALGLALDVQANTVAITAGLPGDVTKLAKNFEGYFASSGKDTPEIPQSTKTIAGLSIFRDFGALYRNRESLVPASSLPEFDKFESGIATLIPGKSFGADVIGDFGKSLTIVIAEQDYSLVGGKPGLQLPGLALIFDLDKPEQAAGIFSLLFQTVLTINNFEAPKQGGRPMTLSTEVIDGIAVSFGKFLDTPKGEKLAPIYNFNPSSALVGSRYVFSTSRSLCRDLVKQFKTPATVTDARANSPVKRNSEVIVLGKPVAELAVANKESVVAQLIKDGRSSAQAETEFEMLLTALRAIDSVRLATAVKPAGFELRVEANWK